MLAPRVQSKEQKTVKDETLEAAAAGGILVKQVCEALRDNILSEEEKKNYSCLVLLEAGSAARPGLKKGYILTDEEISFKFVVHADRMGSIDVANNNGDIIETHRGPDI